MLLRNTSGWSQVCERCERATAAAAPRPGRVESGAMQGDGAGLGGLRAGVVQMGCTRYMYNSSVAMR